MVHAWHAREGNKPQAERAACQESDEAMVPKKLAKTRVTPVESVEGRAEAEGNAVARNTPPTQGGQGVLTDLRRLGHRAKESKEEKLTNLLHFIKLPLLLEAYKRLRKNAAAGVDEVTWAEYGQGLHQRLVSLQDRVHRGSYHPQPVRRVYIPKGPGRMRPLGIPVLEDKLLQQAVRMVLEPIYEAQFVGFSYGFRPGRSPHDALDALAVALGRKVNFVLEADIQSFYDTIDHGWMQKFIEHRIGDGRLVRLLMKWLKAGVLWEGELYAVEEGTPQGGVISPLLANIYLHYVLDLWVQKWRKQPGRAEVYIVRYADDFTMGFQREEDARAMHAALRERLAKYGLKLHPEKTRVMRFGRYARKDSGRDGRTKPATFDFLGLTHISGVDRKTGWFQLRRQTSRKKRLAKLVSLREQMRQRRHEPVGKQHQWLCTVLSGHYRYYGVPLNYAKLAAFLYEVQRSWYRSLQRRGQRRRWNTARSEAMAQHFPLPKPQIHHPFPIKRLHVR
jgi:group II intron reverse transcriptase/maturase